MAKEYGKYLTVTVAKKTEEEARAYFNRISAEFAALFAKLGSKFEEVTAEEKLRILFDFFHYGAEDDYHYDAGLYAQRGYSFKDAIAPTVRSSRTDCFKMDGRYGRVLPYGAPKLNIRRTLTIESRRCLCRSGCRRSTKTYTFSEKVWVFASVS